MWGCTKNVDNYYICDNQADNAYITIHPISGIDIDNVAFVVLSSGANYNNQTRGNTKVISAVTINTATHDDIVDYFSGGGDPNRPEYYDDIVRWVTIFDLKRAADCKSKDICYGPGVRVINRYNSTLWYKILDDAVCNPVFPSAGWLNNSSVSFNSHQTFELYTNSSCSALIGQVTSTGMMYVNYHQLMSLDVNRNCVVEIIRDTFPSSTRYDIQDD